MAGIFETINDAFDSALYHFGVDNNIKTDFENDDEGQESIDTPYLAGFLILAPTQQADLGYNEERQGLFQVDINYQSGAGTAPINAMADLLNNKFNAGSYLTRDDICIEITSFDYIFRGLTSVSANGGANGWAKGSATINFSTYTKRI